MTEPLDLNAQLARCAAHGDVLGMGRAIELGANPEAMESFALGEAAASGHANCVKFLIPLSRPSLLDARPLRLAAYNGHAECVSLLIPGSAILPEQCFALQLAALGGHAGCVAALLPHINPLARNSEALIWAAGKGRLQCVEMLLSAAEHGSAACSLALARALVGGHASCARLLAPLADPRANYAKSLLQAAEAGRSEALAVVLGLCSGSSRLCDLHHIRAAADASSRHGASAVLTSFIEAAEISWATPRASSLGLARG